LIVNLILFWPNSEIWTYSNNFMLVFPPVALLCALLVNLSSISLRDKILLNGLLATVSTYWWANGMMLWLLGVPLSRDGKSAKWYLVYITAAVINISFYFHGYHRPQDSPPFSWHPAELSGYFFTWLGAFFGDEQKALGLGVGGLVLLLVSANGSLLRAFDRRDFTACYPWLVLGLYAIASGVLAAIGRSGLGISQAMSPRYTAVSGYLYIAAAGLGYLNWQTLREKLPPNKLRFPRFAVLIAAVLCIPLAIQSYARGLGVLTTIGEHRKALLVAWQWSKAIPQSPELELLLPNVGMLQQFGGVLEEHNVLRIPRMDPQIMAHWSYSDKAADAANGVLNSCEVTSDGWLSVSGWSRLPDHTGSADCVLLTVSGPGSPARPLAMLPTDLPSPDIAAALNDNQLSQSAFNMALPMDGLPKGRLTVAAWAVDLKQSMIRPLAHTFIAEER